jgi:hypothetical protein
MASKGDRGEVHPLPRFKKDPLSDLNHTRNGNEEALSGNEDPSGDLNHILNCNEPVLRCNGGALSDLKELFYLLFVSSDRAGAVAIPITAISVG